MKQSENHTAIIEDMTRRIVERISPERVVLYGSHARGEAGEQSDVDLLVLFHALPDRRRTSWEAYLALLGAAYPKDIVVATTEEFERYRNVANTLHAIASREGKVLYEKRAADPGRMVFEAAAEPEGRAAGMRGGGKQVPYEGQA